MIVKHRTKLNPLFYIGWFYITENENKLNNRILKYDYIMGEASNTISDWFYSAHIMEGEVWKCYTLYTWN